MNEQYSNSILVTPELTETWIYHVHYVFFFDLKTFETQYFQYTLGEYSNMS